MPKAPRATAAEKHEAAVKFGFAQGYRQAQMEAKDTAKEVISQGRADIIGAAALLAKANASLTYSISRILENTK